MKKVLIGSSVFLLAFTVFACMVLNTPSSVLYLLNWGEYIDSSLVKGFEKKFNCQVIEETVTSSETMYQKIASGTTSYDVAIPGDYVVTRLYQEGLLMELDVSNAYYANLSSYQTAFHPALKALMDEYMVDEDSGESFASYFMPYFWGTYSLIYSTQTPGVEESVKENGFASLFDNSLTPAGTKKGMYDTARWIVASYLLSQGKDPNIVDESGSKEGDISESLQKEIIQAVKEAGFAELGNDSLKRNVANGKLDMCFTQLGDYFDGLYLLYESGGSAENYKVSVPKVTAAFFDSMVIPSTSKNTDLANKFIDYMLDPEIAYQNAKSISYSPTLRKVDALFEERADQEEFYPDLPQRDFLNLYPNYLNPLSGVSKSYLLESKSNDYLTTCETILNNLSL